jgi:two-component system, cell cycle response regulator
MTRRPNRQEDDDFPSTLVAPFDEVATTRNAALDEPLVRRAKPSTKLQTRPAPLDAPVALKAAPAARRSRPAPLDAAVQAAPAARRTRPAPLETLALPSDANAAADAPSTTPALRLVVRGFTAVERSLLDGTVKLSQRRTPRLQLLADSEVDKADVVMINALDARAMEWAQRQGVLATKAVIWVDGKNAPPGHTLAKRPVQWPILPILLARALEHGPAMRSKSSQSTFAGLDSAPAALSDNAAPRPVLVVDDSLAVRAHLRSQLESRGHQVVAVENVQAALEAVSSTAFACILMDVLMPGVDGYEGCKQIKAKLRSVAKVPVIMLTSKSSPFDRIRGKMAGCDAYLTKPVEAKLLHETLEQQLGRSAPGAAQSGKVADSRPANATAAAPTLSRNAVVS